MTCAGCASGTYTMVANSNVCAPFSTCAAGQFVMTDGTSTSDRVCMECPASQFSTSNNAAACQAWSVCPTGTFISRDFADSLPALSTALTAKK